MSTSDKLATSDAVVRVAFIGAGAVNFGSQEGPWDHASRLETIGCNFVAVVDTQIDKTTAVIAARMTNDKHAHQWRDCKLFSSTEEMLREVTPDCVFIGLPPMFHGCFSHPVELQCLKAGCSVFVEKPLSNAPVDEAVSYAHEVELIRKQQNLIVSVGYMFRHSAFAEKIKQLLRDSSHEVGVNPAVLFNAHYNCAYSNISSPFWWNSEYSGGPIVEQATHFVDLSRYLIGEVDLSSVHALSVRAHLNPGKRGYLRKVPVDESKIPLSNRVPRSHVANFRFQNGAIGTLTHSALLQGSKYDASFEILADGLLIRAENPYSDCPTLKVISGSSDDEQIFKFEGDDAYMSEDREFIEAVQLVRVKHIKANITCDYTDGMRTYVLTCAIRDDALSHCK